MDQISVMLVDDSPTFLHLAKQFLEAHEDVTVIGVANGGEQALAQAAQLQPHIVLVDLAMHDIPGLQVIPRLRNMLPEAGIIALTVMNTDGFRQAALKAGADSFVPKGAMRKDLLPTIRQFIRTGHLPEITTAQQ
ncbi:MAG: response regulator transcription factor [Thermoflexales bacterium]|nr:response regulator transcription factor [Thermoflexales bacterium]